MKTLIKTMALLSVLAVASCQQFKIDTQMTPEKAAASIRMECSAVDVYNLPAQNPGSITFNVSSNTPWTIILSSGADWLNVTPSSSASSSLITDVVVTAQNNTGGDRSATLTLKGDNVAQTKVITVKQAREGKLFFTPMVQDYAACGGPLSFTIQTNVAWEVRSNAGWLTFNRTSGEPDPEGRTITIIATAEPSAVMERVATVTIVAGDDEESFDVSQKGIFEVTEISDAFPTDGGEKTITLRTDLPWTIMADKDWVSFDQESGTGDGGKIAIKATAALNEGAIRSANVKVTAGGVEKTFEVSQKGQPFEIVAPASTELEGEADEITLEVKTALDWTPSTDVEGWTVEKVDNSHFKVIAGWNGLFAAKVGKVAINGAGGATDELELTQACNFTVEGNCEVLEDGSVKISSGAKSRVNFIKKYKHATFILKMGDVHFDDNAEFYLVTHSAGDIADCEIENRINLHDASSNIRLRANAAFPDGSGKKAEGSVKYNDKLNKDVMNTMTEYRVDFVSQENPNPEKADRTLRMAFTFNGTLFAEQWVYDIFDVTTQDMSAPYWFGFYTAQTDGTWYIVKSCNVTLYD